MLSLQHGHYRPDAVERTGVIEPYDVQRYNPVDVARHTIDPFIQGVRAPGPAVAPQPSAEAIANAAAGVAESWASGKVATVHIGAFSVQVSPDQPSQGGLVGKIVETARGIRAGKSVLVESPGSKSCIVKARRGSRVIATGRGVAVKASPGPSATVTPAEPTSSQNSMALEVKSGPTYPSTYQDLTAVAAQGPSGKAGPYGPRYNPPLLDRRMVPSWTAAGRNAIEQGADGYGAQRGVPAVVSQVQSQVATLRRTGI